MTKSKLIQKISHLESHQDYLVTELDRLDLQLKRIGFEGGLNTMKATAQRLVMMAQSQELVEE